MAKSKYFAVATEGATTDGRKIQRTWLEQIAANYSQKKYAARLWLEHIRGILPDSDFKAYGDVLAVKTEENEEGKLVLYAQIEPTPELVQLNKKRQKLYSSMEIDVDFADTGEAYLTGLAITDSPASLGTEMLQFSAKQTVNPLAARKSRPENLFSEAVEFSLELEDADDDEPKPSIFSKVKDLLKKTTERTEEEFGDVAHALEAIATETAELEKNFTAALKTSDERYESLSEKFKSEMAELTGKLEAQQQAFTELVDVLDNTPGTTPRTLASGAQHEADCL